MDLAHIHRRDLCFQLSRVGREHIPADGPLIFAAKWAHAFTSSGRSRRAPARAA